MLSMGRILARQLWLFEHWNFVKAILCCKAGLAQMSCFIEDGVIECDWSWLDIPKGCCMKAIVSRYLTRDNATKNLEFPRDIYHIIHSIWIPHRGCNKEIKIFSTDVAWNPHHLKYLIDNATKKFRIPKRCHIIRSYTTLNNQVWNDRWNAAAGIQSYVWEQQKVHGKG